jgi:hypothetical protein
MSFTSAAPFLVEQNIDPDTATEAQFRAALLHSMKTDTAMGYVACEAFAQVVLKEIDRPIDFIKKSLVEAGFAEYAQDVLRYQQDEATWVDYDPNSKLGRQVTRLMTDVVRPILEEEIGVQITFLNCCKTGSGKEGKKPKPTPKRQFNAQRGPSFDC